MMALHFLNDVVNDAESTQKNENVYCLIYQVPRIFSKDVTKYVSKRTIIILASVFSEVRFEFVSS